MINVIGHAIHQDCSHSVAPEARSFLVSDHFDLQQLNCGLLNKTCFAKVLTAKQPFHMRPIQTEQGQQMQTALDALALGLQKCEPNA